MKSTAVKSTAVKPSAVPTCRRAVILLVEDDPGDQELTRRALADGVLRTELRIVRNGADALDYLLHRNAYQDPTSSPRPDLILLDLNMPRLNGQQFLSRLKQIPECAHLPVVVLTTSNRDEDILRSYDLGCNSYIHKPVDILRFVEVVKGLGHYWFELVMLPPVNSGSGALSSS